MIPIALTTVDVDRITDTGDGYDEDAWVSVAAGVRAVLGEPGGMPRTEQGGGGLGYTRRKLTADPIPGLTSGDRVTDLATGEEYVVDNAAQYPGPLAHTTAGMTQWEASA